MVPNTSSPSTTLEGPSSPFLHFPNWSFLDDVDEELFLSQMLSQQHNINAPVTHDAPVHVPNGANLPTTARANMISCEGDSVAMKAMIPKKAKHLVFNQKEKKKKMEIIPSNRRAGKKDRHSKICTAQGLRDRRMRLSLEIARKFFDLQDMLGFDKASKTIEWLLKNCKAAIQQLTNSHGGEKSMSFSASEESEVKSEAKMEIKQICEEEQEPLVGIACRKKRKRRNSCNEVGAMIITNIHVARESRDKARARARERTREKLMKGQLDQNSNTKSTDSYPRISNKHHHLHAAGHQDSGNNSSPQADLFEEPHASVAVMEELLGITRSSSSSSTFSYNSPDFAANHNKEFLGFLAIQKGLEATIEPAPGCYTMTSIKPSLGNVQIQNIPNEMFRTTMNIAQEYDSPADPSSTFMTISNGGQWNPSSIFVTAPAGTLDQQNHFPNSSILMTRKSNSITTPMFTATRPNNVSFQSHFQGSQFP